MGETSIQKRTRRRVKTIKASEMDLLSRLVGEVSMLRREWREGNLTVGLRFDELGRQLERINGRLDGMEARLDRAQRSDDR